MDREMDREMDALDMYYDDVHHDIVGDVDFYLSESIKYGSRILEVGCGTGRLLLRFAEQGRAVYGIDNSSIAIDLLERKIEKIEMGIRGLIRYELGDVRHYQSSDRFDVIIFANQGFLSMLTVDDQIAALTQMRRNLNPGGVIMIDFFEPSVRAIGEGLKPEAAAPRIVRLGEKAVEKIPLLSGDGYLVHWIKSHWDVMTQVVEHMMIVDEVGLDGLVRTRRYTSLILRWIYRFEFEHLAARCGFRVKWLYGGSQRGPHNSVGQQLFWVLQPVCDEGEVSAI